MAHLIDSDITTLWESVLCGSQQAWESLVESLAPVVFTVPRRMGLDRADSEEVSQQTWMALYVGREKIKDPVTLPAWLIRVASRKAQRLIHKQKRQTEIQKSNDSGGSALPDEELLTLEREGVLRLAVPELDERCRKLVMALFFADPPKPYAQIAKDLGLRPNSLGPIRARCLKRLKLILEEYGL